MGASGSWAWPAGSGTGIGSLPGTDIVEAVATVLGELPDLPYLPELPDRGPGADLIGRGAALLTELPVELYAGQWRVAARPGLDLRRARDLLDRDLDALTDAAHGYTGPLKLQAAGGYTLAAGVDLPTGGRLLHDYGATRDLMASLADGLATHVAEVSRRVPGASVLLQLDEPSLPAVLAGRVPTESGLATLRSVPPSTVIDGLRSIVDTVGVPVVVHCCAPGLPLDLLRQAGVAGVSLDATLVDTAGLDALGEFIDAGLALFAGVVPSSGVRAPSSVEAAATLTALWSKLGFPAAELARRVVVTPTCGLAGASSPYARAALAACVETGRRLADLD
jgi:methionine synthase II (cobalamin-independent)